ncbi:Histidine phosphatase superfamily clade-1 [Trinorchestia longiramus]|nr:Histidine phosphatase superfamily clade-1 [Trinorchestia longiramus]
MATAKASFLPPLACSPGAMSLKRGGPSMAGLSFKSTQSSLELLQQMGFPYKRAQKALAATGNRSVQLASDWLAARNNDPLLDETQAREYVLYLRPTGPLNVQIYEFWEQMLESVGRNAAQNLMPHITLCSHFKVADEHSAELGEMLVSAAKSVLTASSLPLPLPLEKYTSQNYMGLFVTSPAAPVLHSIKRHFIQLATSVCPGVSGSSTEEDLHLTLAYSYTAQQYVRLEPLVAAVDVAAPATWQLCLYSREPRFNGLELYKSVRRHCPSHTDELALMVGEYVLVDGNEATTDGWVRGTSWLTGCTGLVAQVGLVRVPDSDAWTLHRSLTIGADGCALDVNDSLDDCSQQPDAEDVVVPSPPPRSSSCRGTGGVVDCDPLPSGLNLSLLNILGHSEGSRRSMTSHLDSCLSERSQQLPLTCQSPHCTGVSEEVTSNRSPDMPRGSLRTVHYSSPDRPNTGSLTRSVQSFNFPIRGPRRLFVMRHGERCDFTFGDWCKACFDKEGRYSRPDLNLQPSVPTRVDAPLAFVKDGPLTRIGDLQAQLVGEGFAATQTPIHHLYCSPALRCVMTAAGVLRSMRLTEHMPLKLEPGLFEWLAWYPEGVPRFMTNEELIAAGFNIDLSYKPFMPASRLSTDETCEQYYTRSATVTNSILAATKAQGGAVLLVAHGASLDTCTRQLVGGRPRTSAGMTSLLQKGLWAKTSSSGASKSRLLKDIQGGLPEGIQGRLPEGIQGRLPRNIQGGLPEVIQGGLPKGIQGQASWELLPRLFFVWGEADKLVWGEADKLVWGEADKLVWGEADKLVWGEADKLVWGEEEPTSFCSFTPITSRPYLLVEVVPLRTTSKSHWPTRILHSYGLWCILAFCGAQNSRRKCNSDSTESLLCSSDSTESLLCNSDSTESLLCSSDSTESLLCNSDSTESLLCNSDSTESFLCNSDSTESLLCNSNSTESLLCSSDSVESLLCSSDSVESLLCSSDSVESLLCDSDPVESALV